VWDAHSGEPISPPLRLTGAVREAGFSDGEQVVRVTDHSGAVQTWSLRGDDRPLTDLVSLSQVLAGRRLGSLRGLLPLETEQMRRALARMKSDP
jgi:hypothetical protein